VAAGDAERRRLERNLHDGAQQHFVSVSQYLAMAERVLPTDRDRAQTYLREAAEQLRAAHDELRELARGIHPIALTQRGLLGAVQVLARRSPVVVELVGDDKVRFPDPVEAALYYVAAEGLANAGRHAEATTVRVCVSGTDGSATLVVEDDGRGGAALAAGTGLRGLQDRVEALGGALELSSPVGEGTRLRATIPLEEP
jgi:signal transduction histidine kinase